MVSLQRFKVVASSLTESIIAMVITAICLSTVIVIYVNVLQADKNIPSYKAEQKVKELLAQTIDEDLFEDEVFSFESYSINKTVENYNNIEGVYKVVFKVKTANKIHSYKYVIN